MNRTGYNVKQTSMGSKSRDSDEPHQAKTSRPSDVHNFYKVIEHQHKGPLVKNNGSRV